MTFNEVLSQTIAMLRQHGRVSYRTLKRQFAIQDDYLEDLKDAILFAHPEVLDEEGRGLVWTGDAGTASLAPVEPPGHAPLAYTPPYLAEKILTSRSVLEGERKQVTVLFADLKGSTELIRDLDPEQAQAILDPALHTMMDAVHRYEGTVNQVLGDGIMALFGAPIAHEDHAVRACYAALAMQDALRRYADEVRRTRGLPVQMRVGLHSGDVVVHAIANDLHMDYSAVGLTTVLYVQVEDRDDTRAIRARVTGQVFPFSLPIHGRTALCSLPRRGKRGHIIAGAASGWTPARLKGRATLPIGFPGTSEKESHMLHLGLSRFAAGTHAGAAHGVPGSPPASAADRPCP